ncbi:hypothetical protein DPMN_108522 [Dreissena polymorpha]|uniref:Uncharacterized protein n=1 Tax=Dreissena polymorpha TaxID=45954 RepID=A0A9D4K8N7_DREPO|nr:hypothetical protein DPMN_108522 [Dreissena polymorpha]
MYYRELEDTSHLYEQFTSENWKIPVTCTNNLLLKTGRYQSAERTMHYLEMRNTSNLHVQCTNENWSG